MEQLRAGVEGLKRVLLGDGPMNRQTVAHHLGLDDFALMPDGALKDGGKHLAPSLDPLIAGFWVFLGSSCKGFRVIDRGFRVFFEICTVCLQSPR